MAYGVEGGRVDIMVSIWLLHTHTMTATDPHLFLPLFAVRLQKTRKAIAPVGAFTTPYREQQPQLVLTLTYEVCVCGLQLVIPSGLFYSH